MIRQPDPQTVAGLLRHAFEQEGATLAHQKSLNLAAQLCGYKNWAHAQQTSKAHAKSVAPESPAKAPIPVASNDELLEALEWVSRNYLTTLAGKPVRDADECLSNAERLLKRAAELPSAGMPPAPERPAHWSASRVDWAKALACEDLSHLLVNGKRRELCHIGRKAFYDMALWHELEHTDSVMNRPVFEYTVAEGHGTLVTLRVRDLCHATETSPGVIQLLDGRELQLLIEGEGAWTRFSPCTGEEVAATA